jgi:ComB9 competence protein
MTCTPFVRGAAVTFMAVVAVVTLPTPILAQPARPVAPPGLVPATGLVPDRPPNTIPQPGPQPGPSGKTPPNGPSNSAQVGRQTDSASNGAQAGRQTDSAANSPNTPERAGDPTIPLDAVQKAWDDPVPAPGQISPGIRRIKYNPLKVERIRIRQLSKPTIQLPECESLPPGDTGIVNGDSYSFTAKRKGENEVEIFTAYAGVDTNIQLKAVSGRTYLFYVRGESVKTEIITDFRILIEDPAHCGASAAGPVSGEVETVRSGALGMGPPGMGPLGAGVAKKDFVRDIPFDRAKLRFDDYALFAKSVKDAEIAPERVANDGVFTYLDFGDRIDRIKFPVAYLTVDDTDTIVNQRIIGQHGQILVVEAIGDITLKNNERIVCVRYTQRTPPPHAVRIDDDLGRKDKGGWLF